MFRPGRFTSWTRASLIAPLLLLTSSGCLSRGIDHVSPDLEPLQRRESAFLEALAARDAVRAAGFFADDAVLHVAGMPAVEGREAIGGFYGNVFRFLRATAATPEALSVSMASDMAHTTGRVRNTFDAPDGPVEYLGKYLLVWERRGGTWVIVRYAVSNDRPEPARAAPTP